MTYVHCFLLCTPCTVDGPIYFPVPPNYGCHVLLLISEKKKEKTTVEQPSAISVVENSHTLPRKYSPRCRKEPHSPTYRQKSSQISARTSTALHQLPRSTAPPAKTISYGNSTQLPSLAQSSTTESPVSLQLSNCSTSKKRFATSTSPRTVHPRTAFRRSNKRPGTRYRGMERAAIKVRP